MAKPVEPICARGGAPKSAMAGVVTAPLGARTVSRQRAPAGAAHTT